MPCVCVLYVLRAGKRVLVHAGAGGVGSIAIQLAKAQGAHVSTTCSGRNIEVVTQQLGADEAIDYTTTDFESACGGKLYDVVVDLMGGDYELKSLCCLKPRGHFANVLNSGWLAAYPGSQLRASAALLYHSLMGMLLGALRLGPSYQLCVCVWERRRRGAWLQGWLPVWPPLCRRHKCHRPAVFCKKPCRLVHRLSMMN